MLPLGVGDIEGMSLKKGGMRDGGANYVPYEVCRFIMNLFHQRTLYFVSSIDLTHLNHLQRPSLR